MADRQHDRPVNAFDEALKENSRADGERCYPEHQPPPAASRPCPDCAYPELTLISNGEIVSVYKCPKCGHLTAPVKRT
jgi:hypothetical protein